MKCFHSITNSRRINRALSKLVILSATFMLVINASHAAEPLPTQPYLPLTLAQTAANAALKKCTADGHRVSVAVADSAGVIMVILRNDGAGPHTIDSSSRKAYTAASLGRSTLELANFMKDKPEIHGLRDMNEQILMLGGGLPIKVGDELIGGIGVGGAPGADLDDSCAKAGVDAILAKDK